MGVWDRPWVETHEQKVAASMRESFTNDQARVTLVEWWDLERPHLEDLPASVQADVLSWFIVSHVDEIVAFWTERTLRDEEME